MKKFLKFMKNVRFKDVFCIKIWLIQIVNQFFFVFVCKITCTTNEKDSRDIVFDVLTKSKILERLDVSDDFWKRFDVQDKSKKKQVVLYEIENIDNPNILTTAINPKEYFEEYKDYSINKKHKGVKKILQAWILRWIQKD